MSLITNEILFWIYFGIIFSAFPLFVFILAMHFLMPRAVLDRYWKEPHFRPFELMLFSGWSFFAPYRTVMFMWTFMFPRLGKKRGIIEPHRLVPRWYRIVSIILCVWVIVILLDTLGVWLGHYAYSLITGNPLPWDEHAAAIVAIACFSFVFLRQWWVSKRDHKGRHVRPTRRKKDEPA